MNFSERLLKAIMFRSSAVLFILIFFNSSQPSRAETPKQKPGQAPVYVEVVKANVGDGPDDLTVIIPEEAAPEGPMSFAVSSNNEICILDQLSSRIQVFRDGKRIKTIPIPANPGFADIDFSSDNKILLLDNQLQNQVYILDQNGTVLNKLPLAGENIPDAAAVTGLYSRKDGIWINTENRSVRIADPAGNADKLRISVPGVYNYNSTQLIMAEALGEVTFVIHLTDPITKQHQKFTKVFDELTCAMICSVTSLITHFTG